MNPNDQCGYCRTPVRWMPSQGRPIPLDLEPVSLGGDEVIIDGRAVMAHPILFEKHPDTKELPRYTSHFRTCRVLNEKPANRREQAFEWWLRRALKTVEGLR